MAHGLHTAPNRAARLATARAYQRCLRDIATALGQHAGPERRSVKHQQQESRGSSSEGTSSEESEDSEDSDEGSSTGSKGSGDVCACGLPARSLDHNDVCISNSSGLLNESSSSSSSSSDDSFETRHMPRQFHCPVRDEDNCSGRQVPQRRRLRGRAHPWVPPCLSLAGAGAHAYVALVRSVLGSKQVRVCVWVCLGVCLGVCVWACVFGRVCVCV